MEIKTERKNDITEIKERLSNVTNSIEDKTYVIISKKEIKEIISILECLEEYEKRRQKKVRSAFVNLI